MVQDSVKFQNGMQMPLLGLGTWQASNREELEEAMNHAFDAGYRHFDTAYMYTNEHIVGDVLKSWTDSGKVAREELFIVTKLPAIGLDETRVEHFLKLSLAALKLDYVDLYLVHMPIGLKYVDDVTLFPKDESGISALDVSTDLVKVWKAMECQVTKGRAKAIGVSNFNCAQVERIVAAAKIKPANIQVEMHVYHQQKSLRSLCAKHNITICAYGPLGSPGRAQFYAKHGATFVDPCILNDPIVISIAKTHGKTSGQILLRFLVQQNVAVIPKSTNKERIVENSKVFDFTLTPSEMKLLEDSDRGNAGRTFTLVAVNGAAHPEYPFL